MKKIGVGGGCCNCYIILGGGFHKCYTVLYRVGGGQKFPIFALYNMCTIPKQYTNENNFIVISNLIVLIWSNLFDTMNIVGEDLYNLHILRATYCRKLFNSRGVFEVKSSGGWISCGGKLKAKPKARAQSPRGLRVKLKARAKPAIERGEIWGGDRWAPPPENFGLFIKL